MIRRRDNPPPIIQEGIRAYYGPAKDRPFERVFQLFTYASLRYRLTRSDLWFRLQVGCINTMSLMTEEWVKIIGRPEFSEHAEPVCKRFVSRYPVSAEEGWFNPDVEGDTPSAEQSRDGQAADL
jgi:hypothetical protein